MFIKKFKEWMGMKEKLDLKPFNPPYVSEGDEEG